MDTKTKWLLTDAEKDKFIDSLTIELPALRAKAGIAQDELAWLVGVSRQTYGSIERKERKMSWSTYLSLTLFFDYNRSTHQMLRNISAFPEELIIRFNDGQNPLDFDINSLFDKSIGDMLSCLDQQAIHSIKTVLLVEYARCANLPGDAVIKSFDGLNFFGSSKGTKVEVFKSLKHIKEKNSSHE